MVMGDRKYTILGTSDEVTTCDCVTRVVRSVIRWQRYTDGSERQTESLVFWIEEFKGSPADALNTMAARAARSEKPFAAIRWMRPNDKPWSP